MKFNLKLGLFSICLLVGFFFITTDSVSAAYSPHSVETTIKNNWNKNYGYKSGNMRNGVNIVYDVYSKKYFNGGYRIINKDFGQGAHPYLNFRGWAINFGYKRHTAANHNTYIVAQNTSNGTTKIFKADQLNISATEDVEYNNQGPGVWNECPANATKKDNIEDCNMRYDNVGFDAYLPLEDLFPDITKNYSYVLYLVIEVDGHIVYTPLILPFEFDKHTYKGGEVDLTSGVNANKLLMIGNNVLRRTEPRGSGVDSRNRYFTTGVTYTRIDSNEDQTAVWYGVNADGYKRWSSTAYWGFQGNQAQLKFKADDKPPVHVSHSLTGHTYQNGNDYWVQPNKEVTITLRQRDVDSGNDRGYIRLNGSGQDVRYYHNYSGTATNLTPVNDTFKNTSSLSVNGANRTENGAQYGTIQWRVQPKTHAHSYDVMWYYRDKAMNTAGYGDTGMNLRVDGVAPTHNSDSMTYQYYDGSVYWVKPNTNVKVNLSQYDPHSGNKYQYLRLMHDGTIVTRNRHSFSDTATNNNEQITSSNVNVIGVNRTQSNSYGTLNWELIPRTHGHIYDLQYFYQDNVNNMSSDYQTFKKLGVDGEAPIVHFRNLENSFDYKSQDWTNEKIDVRLLFSDEHSGYNRSRYVWTKTPQPPSEEEWSDWNTVDDYIVTIEESGEWYLHVQAVDNLDNSITTKAGLYKINQPPVADFSFSDPNYEGDSIELINLSKDPEGQNMDALWTVKEPNGQTKTYTTWDLTIQNAMPGKYEVTLKVTDEIGAYDQVSKIIQVIPLEINGEVEHTSSWSEIHKQLGNSENQFYSGERFILKALVTDYPTDKVTVNFTGKQVNNRELKINQPLISNEHPIYTGEIYDETMSGTTTKLMNGPAYFIFSVQFSNGVVKSDIVEVEIIDDVYSLFNFYRSS